MNSKSLQYNETANSAFEIPDLPRNHTFATLASKITGWFTRGELEKARARYQARRERAAQVESRQDIVNSLPLDEKQQLGLYQLMD